MSELKATTVYDAYWKANSVGKGTGILIYLKSEVDKVIMEKDAEIEDLLRQNRELCQSLQVMYSKEEYGKLQKEIEELKAALEDVKATAYAESVDAGMSERRLRRALWLARASEASKEVNYWTCQDESSYAIVDFNVRHETIVSYKEPHHRPYKWILIWENVERKCLKKAEKY